MKPFQASLLNAFTLIGLGTWAYFTSKTPSVTALIPVFIGLILLAINSGVKKEAKIPAHIAVLLTLIVLFGLIKPLMGALDRESIIGIVRISLMILTTLIALITFIRSFINVRKQKS